MHLRWFTRFVQAVIPIPGDGGDEVAFKYDGATFTAGTLTPDSGSREVTVEATLSGNAITSGTIWLPVFITDDLDFDGDTANDTNSGDPGTFGVNLGGVGEAYNLYCKLIKAAAGHASFTLTISNSDPGAYNRYVSAFMPDGSVVSSDAISIPGVGAG